MEVLTMTFLGDFLKEKRKEKRMSLRELSRRSGISQPYLSQLETGKNDNPSIDILQKISKGLEVPDGSFLIAAGYISDPFEGRFKQFINEDGVKTTVLPRNNGNISGSGSLSEIVKHINIIADEEDYVMGSEYEEIISSVDKMIRGQILIQKKNRGIEITPNKP